MSPSRIASLLLGASLSAWAVSCSTAPLIDGKRATEYTSDQLLDVAEASLRDGDPGSATTVAEFILRNDFDFARRERVRYIAAEGRFATGEFEGALIHYRRLLDEDPLSNRTAYVADRLWSMGRELIRERSALIEDFTGRHDVGVEALDLLVTRFPKHEHADDAWRELAIAFQADGLHQAAADCFERLARDFRDGEWTDFALYHVAIEYRAMSRGGNYDVEPLLVAHGAFVRYLAIFPAGNFATLARDELRTIEKEITARELKVAEFYRFRGNADGERIHLANAARRFPAAEGAKEAAERLGADVEGDSRDLLAPRSDRPRWATASEKDVLDKGEDAP